jgi:hypothetical protein
MPLDPLLPSSAAATSKRLAPPPPGVKTRSNPAGVPAAGLDAGGGARPRGAAGGPGGGRAAAERAGGRRRGGACGQGTGRCARAPGPRWAGSSASGRMLLAAAARPARPRLPRPPPARSCPHPQVHNASGALLRERTQLAASAGYVDDMLAQAATVSRSLIEQRRVFDGVQVGRAARYSGGGRALAAGAAAEPSGRARGRPPVTNPSAPPSPASCPTHLPAHPPSCMLATDRRPPPPRTSCSASASASPWSTASSTRSDGKSQRWGPRREGGWKPRGARPLAARPRARGALSTQTRTAFPESATRRPLSHRSAPRTPSCSQPSSPAASSLCCCTSPGKNK